MHDVKFIRGPFAALALLVSMVAQATSISGTPPTAVTVGKPYSFTPSLTSPSTCSSCFRIRALPSWATFSAQTGTLSGTPTAAGVWSNIRIYARVNASRVSLAPFTITANVAAPAAAPAAALKISGSPPGSTLVGSYFSFTPTVLASAGAALAFTITNKPAFAAFNASTGLLSGTPAAAATYSNIGIAVSDGNASASLTPFTLAVTAPALGMATLDWSIPTLNTDGSALTDLVGYHVYYGLSSAALIHQVSIASPATTQASIEQLTTGTWYFAISDYNRAGVESAKSAVVSLIVR